jgi:hypothetical protein
LNKNLSDISTDASLFPFYTTPDQKEWRGFGVHRGFYNHVHNQYYEIMEILRDQTKFPGMKKLYVTGHSLGGALAQVFYLIYNSPNEWTTENGDGDDIARSLEKKLNAQKEVQILIADSKETFCECECITFASPQVIYFEVDKSTQPERAERFYSIQKNSFTHNYNFVYHHDVVPQIPLRVFHKNFLWAAVNDAYESQTKGMGFVQKCIVTILVTFLNWFGLLEGILSTLRNNVFLIAKHYKVAGHTIRLGTEPSADVKDGIVSNIDMTAEWASEDRPVAVSVDDHSTVNYVRAVRKFYANRSVEPHGTYFPPKK